MRFKEFASCYRMYKDGDDEDDYDDDDIGDDDGDYDFDDERGIRR